MSYQYTSSPTFRITAKQLQIISNLRLLNHYLLKILAPSSDTLYLQVDSVVC